MEIEATTLVHLLDEGIDINERETARLYAQAERAVDALKRRVIDPFEAYALESGKKEIYKADEIAITVHERKQKRGMSGKQLVDMLQTRLEVALRNNEGGKQMYGVRRFDGTVAMDAAYLADEFRSACEVVLEETLSRSVACKGKRKGEVAKAYQLRLASLHEQRLELSSVPVSDDDAGLYIAAAVQAERIAKKIAKPIAQAYKDAAETREGVTTNHVRNYADLGVLVKTVPREEAPYKGIKEKMLVRLDDWARMGRGDVDGKATFYNADLNNPRAYVSIPHMLALIAKDRAKTDRKQRQEGPMVLYAPETSLLLMGE